MNLFDGWLNVVLHPRRPFVEPEDMRCARRDLDEIEARLRALKLQADVQGRRGDLDASPYC